MLYNNYEANIRKARKENFEKFMELARSKDKDGKINEWYQSYEYILEMENTIEKQKRQIQEYQSCFAMIGKFIPKHSSMHDIIG